MSGLRKAGGIIAVFGGVSIVSEVIVAIFIVFSGLMATEGIVCWIIALFVGVLSIIGGVECLLGHREGGGLVLSAAIIAFSAGLLWYFAPLGSFIDLSFPIWQYSSIGWAITDSLSTWFGIALEGYLILQGGIFILISKGSSEAN